LVFIASDAWKAAYPDAVAGVLLVRGVANPPHHPALDEAKAELERRLRTRFDGVDRDGLKRLEPIAAYETYYRRFKQTYHVRHQLESVVVAGKPIPRRAALVEAMFMAELEHQLLTAGHDADALALPVTVDVAGGDERYTLLNGADQTCKPGDMLMRDGQGVLSSILAGPDRRSRITPDTRRALFAVYGPPGVTAAAVEAHLAAILANVRLIAPEVEAVESRILAAAG
jgi:DNA/RNA-binding domain of Phe-tRNA-synthetase-like protein